MSIKNIVNEILNAEAAKRRALATLHTELGYASGRELADAIIAATAGASPSRGPSVSSRPIKPRGRALDPNRKQAIAKALKEGVGGTQVARDFGVSYPTVHAIKKSLGLVNARPRQ